MNKEDVVHIYSGILLSHKKEQNNAICRWQMNLEMFMLNEISQREKDKYHMVLLMSVILKNGTKRS